MDYNNMFKNFKQDELYLKRTKSLKDHDSEIAGFLEICYGQKGLEHRLGTLINAIFTQQTQTFLISRKSAIGLFQSDDNSKYKTLGYKDYGLLLAKITNSPEDFQCLRQPTNNKAGVYKLVQPDLVECLVKQVGRKFLEAQEKKALEFYDRDDVDLKELAERTRKSLRADLEKKLGRQS